MRYSIAFKNLPFEPEKRQVIYVENQYDERINAVIKRNYEQIKWTFKQANLDFVYLPMFFNDEETKEKILYYAPYLTSDIIEKAELRSSYLLRYMCHIENKEKITPSFLYAPSKEDDEWFFQGQSIDIAEDENASFVKGINNLVLDIEEELARNQQKSEKRFDEDIDEGIDDVDVRFHIGEENDQKSSKVEYSSTPDWRGKWGKWLSSFRKKAILEEEDDQGKTHEPSTSTLDDINEEDVRDTLEELEKNIERLRLWGIPLSAIAEFVAKYETVSRILLTNDLRILLPDYNNREVEMGPLYKAVYFLFLNHPEGIVLKHLEEYHRELVNYYLQTSQKKELTPRMIDTINSLEYPGNNSINSTLSRIKQYFKCTIDEHLAKNYYIVGRPGEPYKIALDNILVEWEEEYD